MPIRLKIMKKYYSLLFATILFCGMVMVSCTANDDNSAVTPENGYVIEVEDGMTMPKNGFLKVPAVAGDQKVIDALNAIEKVTDVKAFQLIDSYDYYNEKALSKTAYYFNYKQDIDHNNPSKGWFRQQCVLTVAGQDRPTVLHTEGYKFADNNELQYMDEPMLVAVLDANCLQVEHRYHGWSLPEGYSNKFNYLNTKQQSDDLHAIVTAIKQSGIVGKNSKWLSTGVSKNGMTTAYYAYHYPNEMDAYVPFCAPFMVGLTNPGPYSYILKKESLGGDETRINALRDAFRNYISDKELQGKCVKLYKQKNAEYTYTDEVARKSLLLDMFANYFLKMSYVAFSGWEPMIPKKGDSAEKYFDFIISDQKWKKFPGETDTQYNRRKYYVDDVESENGKRSAPYALRRTKPVDRFLPYNVQTCIDLGDFAYLVDWVKDLLTDEETKHITGRVTPATYGVTYDDGKFIKEFLEGMKTSDCNMMFVYGLQDPWTGAQIPDENLGKNSRKLMVSSKLDKPDEAGFEAGLHNDDIDKWAPSDRNELFKWLNKIGFLPR